MSPIGHFAVGLAVKPAAPKVPLFVLLVATLILDLLYFVFAFAGMEGLNKEIPWSHGLFMSELDLSLPWDRFDITHELTKKGIEKFVADYESTLKRTA